MIYDRFIDNQVLQKCRRPQRKDWCAPITVGEVIEILTGKHISIDQIAKTMHWMPDTITRGSLGTGSVIQGVQKVSGFKIHSKILKPQDIPAHWKKIREHVRHRSKVLYYHQPGHHLLITGFIEEPLVMADDLWNHQHVGKNEYTSKRKWLIKAEHNVKTTEYIQQGVLVPVEFKEVCRNIAERKNSDLVLFWV